MCNHKMGCGSLCVACTLFVYELFSAVVQRCLQLEHSACHFLLAILKYSCRLAFLQVFKYVSLSSRKSRVSPPPRLLQCLPEATNDKWCYLQVLSCSPRLNCRRLPISSRPHRWVHQHVESPWHQSTTASAMDTYHHCLVVSLKRQRLLKHTLTEKQHTEVPPQIKDPTVETGLVVLGLPVLLS